MTRVLDRIPIESAEDLAELRLIRLDGFHPIWQSRIAAINWAVAKRYPGPEIGFRRVLGVDAIGKGAVDFAVHGRRASRAATPPIPIDVNYGTTISVNAFATLRPFTLFSSIAFSRLVDPRVAERSMAVEEQAGHFVRTNPPWLSVVLHEFLHPPAREFRRTRGSEASLARAFEVAHHGSGEHFLNRDDSPRSRRNIDALITDQVSGYATDKHELIPEALTRYILEGSDAPPLSRFIGMAVDGLFRYDATHLAAVNRHRLSEIIEKRANKRPQRDRTIPPERELWIPEWGNSGHGVKIGTDASGEWRPLSLEECTAELFTTSDWLQPWARGLSWSERRHFTDRDLAAFNRMAPGHVVENAECFATLEAARFQDDIPLGPASKIDWRSVFPRQRSSVRNDREGPESGVEEHAPGADIHRGERDSTPAPDRPGQSATSAPAVPLDARKLGIDPGTVEGREQRKLLDPPTRRLDQQGR